MTDNFPVQHADPESIAIFCDAVQIVMEDCGRVVEAHEDEVSGKITMMRQLDVPLGDVEVTFIERTEFDDPDKNIAELHTQSEERSLIIRSAAKSDANGQVSETETFTVTGYSWLSNDASEDVDIDCFYSRDFDRREALEDAWRRVEPPIHPKQAELSRLLHAEVIDVREYLRKSVGLIAENVMLEEATGIDTSTFTEERFRRAIRVIIRSMHFLHEQ